LRIGWGISASSWISLNSESS